MAFLEEGGFMKLHSGSLHWDKTVEPSYRFEKVSAGKETQVLIAGGGISGTLCACVFSALGMDVILAEKNRIGKGSSLASTGLLQYRSDKMLCELVDDIGEERGRLFYRMCLEAMDQLKRRYCIHKPCALRTWHDADVNPYGLILKDYILWKPNVYKDIVRMDRGM